jgi:hypothetical protein
MQTQPNATANIDLYLSKTGVLRSTTIYYNEKLNLNISSNDGTNAGAVLIGNCTLTSGVISNFQPKLLFRAVDYSDFNATTHITETYVNGKSWYRVYSDGWCEQGGAFVLNTTSYTFLKRFKDTNISMSWFQSSQASGQVARFAFAPNQGATQTGFTVQLASNPSMFPATWEAKGYIF